MLDLDSIGRRKPNASADDWLVKDVSLKLTPGDRLAITGPSGAGKTVLLRLIALLEEPDAGECRWEGRTVSDAQVPAYRRDVIYLHQRPHFVDGTVRENLNLPFQFLANKGLQYSEATVGETLDRIQRPRDLLNRNVQALSGGETQLVALLRALQLQPRVLLLDEPTASADEQLASAIEQLVMQWCQNGQAMLFVSHKLDQIERLSNRRLGLEQGRAV